MSTTFAIEAQTLPVSTVGLASQPEARPVIQLENIHKVYTMGDVDVHALRGVSLTIREGEFVAIMGASGSGKSTTMNIIGCLDRPTRGQYILAGENVSGMSKDERADIRCQKIGFVFQGFNLHSRTSVEVMEIFQRLNRERGITLVLVTHEPDIADYAQRIVVFKDGKIKKDYQIESPRDAAEELRNLPPVVEDDDEDQLSADFADYTDSRSGHVSVGLQGVSE